MCLVLCLLAISLGMAVLSAVLPPSHFYPTPHSVFYTSTLWVLACWSVPSALCRSCRRRVLSKCSPSAIGTAFYLFNRLFFSWSILYTHFHYRLVSFPSFLSSSSPLLTSSIRYRWIYCGWLFITSMISSAIFYFCVGRSWVGFNTYRRGREARGVAVCWREWGRVCVRS